MSPPISRVPEDFCTSKKKKIIVILTIFLCTAVCTTLYHISDAFVKLPDYNGFDEEALADIILIEKTLNSFIGFVILGDGSIYSFHKDNGFYFRYLSEDYKYTKECIEKYGTLELIRVSKRDSKRILQYIPYIDPNNYEEELGAYMTDSSALYTEIYDHANQRRISLRIDGFYLTTNTSPNTDALIKLVNKYDRMMYCLYKIKGEIHIPISTSGADSTH